MWTDSNLGRFTPERTRVYIEEEAVWASELFWQFFDQEINLLFEW